MPVPLILFHVFVKFICIAISKEWWIYASMNYAIIGSDYVLGPERHQAIIKTNTGVFRLIIQSKKQWNLSQNTTID